MFYHLTENRRAEKIQLSIDIQITKIKTIFDKFPFFRLKIFVLKPDKYF